MTPVLENKAELGTRSHDVLSPQCVDSSVAHSYTVTNPNKQNKFIATTVPDVSLGKKLLWTKNNSLVKNIKYSNNHVHICSCYLAASPQLSRI